MPQRRSLKTNIEDIILNNDVGRFNQNLNQMEIYEYTFEEVTQFLIKNKRKGGQPYTYYAITEITK